MNDTLEILTKLIAFDSTSHRSNLPLIEFIQNYLADLGIRSHLTHSSCNAKANLLATIPAHDGSTQGGLLLSGHTDVVPVDGQNWSYPPFSATLVDGKIYGRGSCDMKGFIAVVLALLPEILQNPLKKPLHLAFSFDEEVGCCGAPILIEDLLARGLQPELCIVGEPTSMKAVVAHKGINIFHCHIRGKASHSSLTNQGCNAIDYAAEVIIKIRQLAEQLQHSSEQDNAYDVPYSTMSTNLINGGNAQNTIPSECEFYFDLRNLPHLSPTQIVQPIRAMIANDILPRMRKEFPDAEITLTQRCGVPGLEYKMQAELTTLMQQLSSDNSIYKVAYGTEAGLFQASAIPTLVCGPGSIEQAHRADEYIEIEQLWLCRETLRKII